MTERVKGRWYPPEPVEARDPGDQMRPTDVLTPDDALAYALQTHLCYSAIQPGDRAFRVLKERLERTGYALRADTARVPEGLREAVETLLEEINVVITQGVDPDWLEPYAAKVRAALASLEGGSDD